MASHVLNRHTGIFSSYRNYKEINSDINLIKQEITQNVETFIRSSRVLQPSNRFGMPYDYTEVHYSLRKIEVYPDKIDCERKKNVRHGNYQTTYTFTGTIWDLRTVQNVRKFQAPLNELDNRKNLNGVFKIVSNIKKISLVIFISFITVFFGVNVLSFNGTLLNLYESILITGLVAAIVGIFAFMVSDYFLDEKSLICHFH